ncbi:50S ribosomal protein L30 [Candidatus Woesearchaeota archaeon CG10_big_fil_rev_8_21_14_0_10_32_24]|nr:MAG: 50S ribosomal protein L30 [Candidatus Woesearchaeota archaeon CG10_big_fil_rev_8_21_14_0_10_32_24]
MTTENQSKKEQSSKPASTHAKSINQKTEPKASTGEKIAIVLVRGLVDVSAQVKDTLQMLHLTRKNHCVVIVDNPVNRGMIKKVKDYIAYGEISEETYNKLVEKRGTEFQGREQDGKKKYSYKFLEINGKKYKPYFRLNPPRKGFGRKGIKVAFKAGGSLGNRGNKMNDLIERML